MTNSLYLTVYLNVQDRDAECKNRSLKILLLQNESLTCHPSSFLTDKVSSCWMLSFAMCPTPWLKCWMGPPSFSSFFILAEYLAARIIFLQFLHFQDAFEPGHHRNFTVKRVILKSNYPRQLELIKLHTVYILPQRSIKKTLRMYIGL